VLDGCQRGYKMAQHKLSKINSNELVAYGILEERLFVIEKIGT
jgi:hypothetical protein